MTEPYKPWEGKHFKERKRIIEEIYRDDSISSSLEEIIEALKKDWEEQGKDPQLHYPGCQRQWMTKEKALEKWPKERE